MDLTVILDNVTTGIILLGTMAQVHQQIRDNREVEEYEEDKDEDEDDGVLVGV